VKELKSLLEELGQRIQDCDDEEKVKPQMEQIKKQAEEQ